MSKIDSLFFNQVNDTKSFCTNHNEVKRGRPRHESFRWVTPEDICEDIQWSCESNENDTIHLRCRLDRNKRSTFQCVVFITNNRTNEQESRCPKFIIGSGFHKHVHSHAPIQDKGFTIKLVDNDIDFETNKKANIQITQKKSRWKLACNTYHFGNDIRDATFYLSGKCPIGENCQRGIKPACYVCFYHLMKTSLVLLDRTRYSSEHEEEEPVLIQKWSQDLNKNTYFLNIECTLRAAITVYSTKDTNIEVHKIPDQSILPTGLKISEIVEDSGYGSLFDITNDISKATCHVEPCHYDEFKDKLVVVSRLVNGKDLPLLLYDKVFNKGNSDIKKVDRYSVSLMSVADGYENKSSYNCVDDNVLCDVDSSRDYNQSEKVWSLLLKIPNEWKLDFNILRSCATSDETRLIILNAEFMLNLCHKSRMKCYDGLESTFMSNGEAKMWSSICLHAKTLLIDALEAVSKEASNNDFHKIAQEIRENRCFEKFGVSLYDDNNKELGELFI